jgi:glyoxylase-like metal-dependent hydrolase (beta-lactamase superfamily II)
MKISVIDAGNFKLDGGAMFGVVPKTIWQKMIPADELNLCSWKMRCLLVENEGKLILTDTGMGDKQPEKWQGYYFKHGDGDLIQSIRNAGYHEDEVTDVILSHLHFDHCGGAVSWNTAKDGYQLTFKNARYWTHSAHWDWAIHPNLREKATFLTENLLPLEESGHLNFIDQQSDFFGDKFSFLFADGHTEKMIMPVVTYKEQKIIFIADTVPSHAHIHVPYCMSYDIRPLQTMQEKESLLQTISDEKWLIFYDHDPVHEVSGIIKTEKGFKPEFSGSLKDFVSL